jgi:thiosulfate dehydrogenase [quinone] large subunit
LFYQGFGKLISANWSAWSYLEASWGPFLKIAESPTLLLIADYTTIWALMLIGLFLMVGLFSRLSAIAGVLLLGMIYAAIPPVNYTGFVMATSQGTELYVDKTFIEILALLVVASFDTGRVLGLDILIDYWRNR